MTMSDFRRQHPIVIVTGVFRELRSFILPFLIFLVLSVLGEEATVFGGRGVLIFALISIGFSMLAGLLKWVFFRYAVSETVIQIHSGVFIKKQRHIKRERIQTISLEAGLWHRIFNLTAMNIETAGNLGESELQIQAIPIEEAETIRNQLTREQTEDEHTLGEADSAPGPKQVLNALTLFKAGLTSGSVMVVMLLMAAFVGQLIFFLPSSVFEQVLNLVPLIGWRYYLFVGSVLILVAWIISVFRYMIRYGAFTIRLEGDDLIMTRGLIVLKTLTLKSHRIQSVIITQGLLREPFRYATIEVRAAGGRADDETLSGTVIHPLIKMDAIPDFLAAFLPDVQRHEDITPVPTRARIRFLIRNLALPTLALSLGFLDIRFLWVALSLPFLTVLALAQHAHAGTAFSHDAITLQMRGVAKKWVMARKPHVQALSARQSLIQRVRRLSTVAIHILATPSAAIFSVRDVDLTTADQLYQWLKHPKLPKTTRD